MQDCVAVVNAGSSSIKFALYDGAEGSALLFRGQIENINAAPRLKVVNAADKVVVQQSWTDRSLDHRGAIEQVLQVGSRLGHDHDRQVRAIGHRVVHGGLRFAAPILIDGAVLAALDELVPLAPLHQPHNLAAIRAVSQVVPALPQVACFDTAFHRGQPAVAQSFALPREFTDSGVRRYGFHGLSYDYISSRLAEIDPALARKRIIVAHLGNGASLCAIRDGRSVASTMGFTAVDGLMMGTRCGAIDPGVILYLMDQHGMDARAIESLIYNKSGLLGVSGISADMRALRASPAVEAKEAIELFVYRIAREIGSMSAALDGLDGLVFTGGIGENDVRTRAEVAARCGWLGLTVDPRRNEEGSTRISADDSRVATLVIPTDEERMIARYTVETLQRRPNAVSAALN